MHRGVREIKNQRTSWVAHLFKKKESYSNEMELIALDCKGQRKKEHVCVNALQQEVVKILWSPIIDSKPWQLVLSSFPWLKSIGVTNTAQLFT